MSLFQKAYGVDFTLYKSSTLERRMLRRMLLNKVEGYDDFARYLSAHTEEFDNLYQDILILAVFSYKAPRAS